MIHRTKNLMLTRVEVSKMSEMNGMLQTQGQLPEVAYSINLMETLSFINIVLGDGQSSSGPREILVRPGCR